MHKQALTVPSFFKRPIHNHPHTTLRTRANTMIRAWIVCGVLLSLGSFVSPVSAQTAREYKRTARSARPQNAPPRLQVLIPRRVSKPKPIAYLDIVRVQARTHGLPVAFVLAVIKAESAFKPRAQSHAGAQGLMQLMPSIQKYYGVSDPFDPEQNVAAGCALLATLKKRYKGDTNKILAAYNAGGVHVRRRGGIPWPKTKVYVSKIVRYWSRYERRLAVNPKQSP